MPAAVIQTPKHNKRLARFQLRIHNALVPVRSEVRPLVAPEVTPRHDPRCADLLGRVASRYEEAEQHVSVFVVLLDFRVARVVVLVISVEFLCWCAGADIHGYSDREQRVRGVCRGLLIVPVCSLYSEELLC